MTTKTTPELHAELYYSERVYELLQALAADSSPTAQRRIAQHHAAILGHALPSETSSSLVVTASALPECVLSSIDLPYRYRVRLTDNLTHVALAQLESAHTPLQDIRLSYSGVVPLENPTAVAVGLDNPLTADWLYSSAFEPALTKSYTWNGKRCTLRSRLLEIAAMSDDELFELTDNGPVSSRHHTWLMNKGFMLWCIPNEWERHKLDPERITVRCFTSLKIGSLLPVLRKKHGAFALEVLRTYLGTAGFYDGYGDLVGDLPLLRRPAK